jgi:hypothetical protein
MVEAERSKLNIRGKELFGVADQDANGMMDRNGDGIPD